MNVEELVRRSQAGDQEAFCALVEHHRKVLFGTAYLMTRDRGLAEDAVQEALIQMWRHLPSFRLQGSFKAWLLRIVVNEVKQQHRGRQAPSTSLDTTDIGGDDDEAEAPAMHHEECRAMRKALAALPKEQRETVVLRYYADLSEPEIAKTLGCVEGTVKSRLSRALDRLALVLRDGKGQSGLRQEG